MCLRRWVALEYGLVWLGLHCFLRFAHALYCRSRQCLASVAFSGNTVEVRFSMHPHRPHATSQPQLFSHTHSLAAQLAQPLATAHTHIIVERQRRAGIVAELPRLKLGAGVVEVMHASARSCAAQGSKEPGWTPGEG